ncbi:MAG: ATP-binding cassette domain-containing protein, partial [Desulfosporosinus sp.]
MNDMIEIKGLHQNNLKNISLSIPKNKIVVFTGVSGSGKSSIVFDTIAAESQRQMNE